MKVLYGLLALFLLLAAILPIWVVVTGAFSDWSQPFAKRVTLQALTTKNLFFWRRPEVKAAQISLGTWVTNSFIYCTIIATVQAVLSMAAAYGMARFEFVGKRLFSALIIVMTTVPSIAMYVPMYMVIVRAGLVGKLGFVLPQFLSAGAILTARQFARGLSHEVFEAARVDGANEVQIFWHVALPMLRPIFLMLFSASFCGMWANLIWSNVMLRAIGDWTIAQGIAWFTSFWRLGSIADTYGMYSVVMLAAAIPPALVYIVSQQSIARGLEGLITEV